MVLAACSSEKKSVTEHTPVSPQIVDENRSADTGAKSPTIITEEQQSEEWVDPHYAAYSFSYSDREFMVTGSHIPPRGSWFDGTAAYGLSLDDSELLEPQFDKIGSPNILAANCIEVVSENKSGLYNLVTRELLPPQYDLLFPSLEDSLKTSLIAQKGGLWYRFQVNDFSTKLLPEFSLAHYLQSHNYTLGNERSYGLTLKGLEGRYKGDNYYVVVPHYLVVLKLFPPQLNYSRYIHAPLPYVKTIASKSFGTRIISVLLAIYDESFNVRDIEAEQVDMVVFRDNEEITRQTIDTGMRRGKHEDYRYINDSLVEAKVENEVDDYGNRDQVNPYKYYQIARDGKVTSLSCNRTFGFTKFAFIDSSYFEGRFILPMTATEKDEFAKRHPLASERCSGNWITEHLSIEDLDIMRNEIFATYGFRFKTAQWQEYFSTKSWYHACHDDVNHLLSERDKHNIQVILSAKKRLEKNADAILNKTPQLHLSVP